MICALLSQAIFNPVEVQKDFEEGQPCGFLQVIKDVELSADSPPGESPPSANTEGGEATVAPTFDTEQKQDPNFNLTAMPFLLNFVQQVSDTTSASEAIANDTRQDLATIGQTESVVENLSADAPITDPDFQSPQIASPKIKIAENHLRTTNHKSLDPASTLSKQMFTSGVPIADAPQLAEPMIEFLKPTAIESATLESLSLPPNVAVPLQIAKPHQPSAHEFRIEVPHELSVPIERHLDSRQFAHQTITAASKNNNLPPLLSTAESINVSSKLNTPLGAPMQFQSRDEPEPMTISEFAGAEPEIAAVSTKQPQLSDPRDEQNTSDDSNETNIEDAPLRETKANASPSTHGVTPTQEVAPTIRAGRTQLVQKDEVDAVATQVQQRIDEIEHLRPGSTLTIRLEPNDLGQIDVTVRQSGGRVQADFVVTREPVREMLASNRSQLADAFAQRGIDLGSMNVSSGNSQGQSHSLFSANERQQMTNLSVASHISRVTNLPGLGHWRWKPVTAIDLTV